MTAPATRNNDCVSRTEHRALYAMVLNLQNDVLTLQQRLDVEQDEHGHALKWNLWPDSLVDLQAIAEDGTRFASVEPAGVDGDGWLLLLADHDSSIHFANQSEAIAEAQRLYVKGLQS